MLYNQLPRLYRVELDLLEPAAQERLSSGTLNDLQERRRRYNLLTADVVMHEQQADSNIHLNFGPWDYIDFDENYLVTALPEETSGVTHSEIIYNEFHGIDVQRLLPHNDSGSFVTKNGFVIDRFYTTFCGDTEIDSEVLAFTRKLRSALEVVPGILFVYQNRQMLQTEE